MGAEEMSARVQRHLDAADQVLRADTYLTAAGELDSLRSEANPERPWDNGWLSGIRAAQAVLRNRAAAIREELDNS
jgi:hypothetical protein